MRRTTDSYKAEMIVLYVDPGAWLVKYVFTEFYHLSASYIFNGIF